MTRPTITPRLTPRRHAKHIALMSAINNAHVPHNISRLADGIGQEPREAYRRLRVLEAHGLCRTKRIGRELLVEVE